MGPELLIPLLGSVLGGLGGIFGDSSKDKDLSKMLLKLQSMIPELQKGAFTNEQLLSYATNAKKNITQSGDIAAAGIASSISERSMASGVPEGQPSNSMYVSEIAPVKAQAIQSGERTFLDFISQIEMMDAQKKSNVLQALGLSSNITSSKDDMNWFGKGLSGILQGGNLGMTALGNYGQYDYWKNKENVTVK